MMTNGSAAACKHPTEKLMRGGFGGGATPPTGGLGGRTPQKLGFSREFPLKNPNLVDLQSGVYLPNPLPRLTAGKMRQLLICSFRVS